MQPLITHWSHISSIAHSSDSRQRGWKLWVWLLFVSLLCFRPLSLSAATISWAMPAGGAYTWSNGANWVGGVAPGPGDVANFPDLGVYSTITLSGLPASVQGIINISGRNVEIAAGSTLVITAAGSNVNGVSFVDVSGTIEFTNTASTTGASGYRIQSGGRMRINGNPTIAGLPVQYFAGSTLEYSGSGNRTTSLELPATMNGAVIINKTLSAETITLSAGTSIAGLTVTQGVFDAAGFSSTLSANSSVAATGTIAVGAAGLITVAAGQTLTANGVFTLAGPGNRIDLPGSTIVLGTSFSYSGGGLIKADANGIVRVQCVTLDPAWFTSFWIYSLIVDRVTDVTYTGGLTVGNGGLQLANTGNLVVNCGGLTIIDGVGVTQTSTGRISANGCGSGISMEDDNLDGNHYVPGMNNLYINRAGGVNLTNTIDIVNLNYTAGALNINNTGNLIFTIPGGVSVSGGRTLNINNGGRVTVLPGKYFNNDGTVNVNAGGVLVLDADAGNNGVVGGTNPITYAASTSILRYIASATTVPTKIAGPELPTPTMPGKVEVIRTGGNILQINKVTDIQGGLDVQSGFCEIVSPGNVTLGAGSLVHTGALLRASNGSTVSGGANLTVQTGAILTFLFSPTATWTGTPTYAAGSLLYYDNTTRTTGAELPAVMAGNVNLFGGTCAITLGANAQLNGNFLMTNSTFTVASPNVLTFASATNIIDAASTFTVNAGAAECVIISGANLTNNGTMNINGTLTLDGTGVYNVASANSPTITGVLRYTGTNPSYITGKEFPSVGVSSLVVNRAVAGNIVILQNAKTVGVNATITQGILQTSTVGASLTHSITGNLVVAANGRLRVQENSVVNVGVATTYSAATATLEYAGTTGKAAAGGELPATFGGSIIVNNTGHVNAPASPVSLTTSGAGFTLTAGNWKIPAGGSLALGTGVSLFSGGATSYIETAPAANGNNATVTRNLSGAAFWPIGSTAGYRPVTTGLPSVTPTNITLGAASASPTGSTDNVPFIGSAASPGYWYISANPTCTALVTVNNPSVTATSRLGTAVGANAGGSYSDVLATANPGVSIASVAPVSLVNPNYTFFAIGTGPSANSDIIETPGYTYSSSIAHSNAANREPSSPTIASDVLWSMRLRDGGGAADADGLTTEVNSLTLNITTDSPSNPLYQIALFTPGGVQIGATQNVSGTTVATVTFAGLSGANVTAVDDGFIDIILRGTFKQTSVIDTANVRFQVASVTANIGGSTFATANAGGAISINNTVSTGLPADLLKNRIDIVATQLSFPNAIGNQIVNTDFTPSITVLAVDPFFNVDRTITGTITLSSGLFTISAGGSAVVPLGTGTGSFGGLQVSNTGMTGFLTATMGALTGNSTTFDVTTIPTYWDCTIPSTPPPAPILPIGGRNMNFNSVSLNGGGNVLTNVATGASISLTGNWSMNWPGGVYCPGCVVQMYVGIGGGSGFAGNGSSANGFTQCLGSGVYDNSMGAMSFSFNAPTKPGIYYITQNWTLHYYCNPHPVTFNNSPTNAIAVIQVVEPTPAGSCNEPDIIETPSFVYPANINYSAFTSATMSAANPAVWSFRVRDYGTIPSQADVDNKPTQINSLGINVTDPGGVLQEIALYQGTGQISTPITVSGSGLITFPTLGTVVVAPDNGVIDILIRAKFRTVPLTPPMDNRQFGFTINEANVVTAPNAISTQKNITPFAVAASANAGNNNQIEVTATQLQYTAQPPVSTPVGVTMASVVVVRAVDVNNNIDLDYNAPNIDISHPNLIGTPVSVAPVSGVATFPIFAFNNLVASGVLGAASGALTANSSPFDIIPAVFHFMSASGSANILTNWQLNGAGANPVAIGLSGATYRVGIIPGADPALATVTAPLTISAGSVMQVNGTAGGSTLNVLAGQNLTNNGTLSIQGGAGLLLTDDGTIAAVSTNPVVYVTTNATLEYTGAGALNRTTNPIEFPSPLNARLKVSRSAGGFNLNLDASKIVTGEFAKSSAGTMIVGVGQTLALQNGVNISGGALNLNGTGALTVSASGTFLITGGSLNLTGTGTATIAGGFSSQGGAVNIGTSTLSLGGAINFGAGTVTPSAGFGTLDINGTGAISGTLGGGVQFGQFTMNRANQILTLSPGVNLRAANLSLLSGIIRTGAPADYVEVATTLTAMGSATTHIDGKLRQTFPGVLNDAGVFDFPIGKGGVYLPIRFQNVTSNSAVVQAEAFNVGSGGASGVGFSNVSATEHWQTSLQGGTFTSALVQLSRPTPPLVAAAVVGHSGTQTGSYTGIGGSVSSPNVLSASPVLSADRFFALGVLSNVFYYFSGPAENVTSWNSDVLGIGAPATDFITGGTTFIVPSGKTAPFGANQSFGAGVTTLVNGGGTLSVSNGSKLDVGIFRVAADGVLALVDSAKINAPSGVFYLGQTAQLLYQNPVNRVATSYEFPATMPGSVTVSNGTITLETTPTVRNITIQGALSLKNSTLDFGKDSTRLRLEGAISFNPSQFKTNLTHGLTIAGSGAITGSINFSNQQLGWLTLQRSGATMTLVDSLTIGSQLSLLGGNIVLPTAGKLLLANSADTSLVGGSFSSFVDGILARSLPTNLTPIDARSHFYPIGKGTTYLPLTLLNATTGSASPMVAVESFKLGAGGLVVLGANGALSPSEHWRVQTLVGDFAGSSVGVLRPFGFTAADRLGASGSKTGVYGIIGGALTPIGQGTSLVSDPAQNADERFYSVVGPMMGSPRITGFSPGRGGEQTSILITGTNLTGVNAVAIGGIAVSSFTVLSSTTISVSVGAVATGPVQVGSPSGGAASDSNFTFVPSPRIFNAMPSPAGLGVPITINGENFTGASYMNIGGIDVPSNQFTVAMGGNVITTTVPVNATNSTILINAPGGTAISTNALVLIPPPVITSINPQVASTGETVVLFGTNFVSVQSLRFGTTSAQYTVNSPTRITAIVPARLTISPSQVYITVQTGSGTATTATRFAYNPLPGGLPNGVDPLRLVVIGEVRDKIMTVGGNVRVTGANLELIQEIKLITAAGSTNASWLLSSSAALTLIVPTTGLLRNSSGLLLSSAATTMDVLGAFNRVVVNNAFTVVGAPQIVSNIPADGNIGDEITVNGTSMNLITAMRIGGTAATFRIVDSTRVVVMIPARLTADGTRLPASGVLGFTSFGGITGTGGTIVNTALSSGLPVITSFSPMSGPPGTEVVVQGVNLNAVRDVSVVGIPVASFVVNSPTRMTLVLSTAASARSQGPITLQTSFGTMVDSRTPYTFPFSLEADQNAANMLVTSLGGDPSKLEMVTVENRITVLRLKGAGLRGAIPAFIATLTDLRELDLSNNFLSGALPIGLSSLKKLERLNLSNNLFSGALTPGVFCSYENMRYLDVSRNNLTGEIPVCITMLDKIETLNLAYNRFTSLLPWQLGAMTSLVELRVSNNQLTGELPPEIGTGGARVTSKTTASKTTARTTAERVPTVQVIDVSNNQFTGGIPEEWGNIPQLRELNVTNCGLVGSLPSTIKNWQGIQSMRLANNRLGGVIPSFNTASLREFVIDNNRFNGALPESFGQVVGLRVLSAANNRLTSIPNLAQAVRIDTVRLDSNQLEFSSLEPLFARTKVFQAQGQDSVAVGDGVVATLGDVVEISSNIGGANTRYQWYNNGAMVRGATGRTLRIESILPQDVGLYVCRATNSVVRNVTLYTQAVRVSVTSVAQVLASPELLFPTNSASNIAPRPAFRWSGSAGADSYTIVVARDKSLRTDAQSVTVAAPEIGDSVVLAWANAGGRGVLLERGARYYWSVRAASASEILLPSWSDTLSFSVVPFGQDLAFSSVDVGRTTIGDSARATGSIVNIGDDALLVQSAQVESGLANVFALNFTERLLPKDGAASFDVVFKPDRPDTIRANVTVRYADVLGQGARSISIEKALIGRGGALAIEPPNFDSVRIGKASIQSARIINRSDRQVVINGARILLPRGAGGSEVENVFAVVSGTNITMKAGDTAFIAVRCTTTTRGFKYGVLEVLADNDIVQADMRAIARLERPDDAAVSFRVQVTPEVAAPGSAVRLDMVIEDFTAERAKALLQAAQPEVRLVVRFDKQVLALDNADGSARMQRSESDTGVVVLNVRWDGRSRTVASLQARAVAGRRTVTNVEIINAEWGSTSATARPEWEQKVFVEEPSIVSPATFTAKVSQAGGRRLIANASAVAVPLLSLARPNPSSDVVGLTYTLYENAIVNLDVLNTRGEVVQTLMPETARTVGEHIVTASVRTLPTGAYLLRLRANAAVVTQRLDVQR